MGASRVFSGRSLVISLKSETLWKRRPGLVGLRLRRGMFGPPSALEQWNSVAFGESHDGPLGIGPLAEDRLLALPLALALAVEGVDVDHPDVEDLLDGLANLDLVGVRPHDEGVDAVVQEAIGLL